MRWVEATSWSHTDRPTRDRTHERHNQQSIIKLVQRTHRLTDEPNKLHTIRVACTTWYGTRVLWVVRTGSLLVLVNELPMDNTTWLTVVEHHLIIYHQPNHWKQNTKNKKQKTKNTKTRQRCQIWAINRVKSYGLSGGAKNVATNRIVQWCYKQVSIVVARVLKCWQSVE